MQRTIKASPVTARAIAAYLASGGTVKTFAPGKRALPPQAVNAAIYGKRPTFHCIHAPIAERTTL
jgi:hypothetical protein